MSNNKKPRATVEVSFPQSVIDWLDKVRGNKSRSAYLARVMKDMRMDYELDIIINQSEGSSN